MKKMFALFVLSLMLISILGTAFVLAKEGSDSSDSSSSGSSDSDDDDDEDNDDNDKDEAEDDDQDDEDEKEDDDEDEEDEDEDEDEEEIEVEIEEGLAKIELEINETKIKFVLNTTDIETIINEIVSRTGLTREQVESNLEIEEKEEDEEGIKIKTEERFRFIDENGTEFEVRIKTEIRIKDGQEITKQKIKIKDVEADSELELREETKNNITKIKVKLKNGTEEDLKVMPDVASERAIEVLRSKNFTIVLKEVGAPNKTKLVFSAESPRQGKVVGLFRAKFNLEARIDSQTGEVVEFKKPWWYFLITGEEPSPPEQTNETAPEEVQIETTPTTP